MAWNSKVTKQDLIDAGLDPDKFATLIGSSVTKDELNTMKEALKTEVTASVTQIIKDELAGLEGRLKPQPDKKEPVNQNQPQELTAEDFLLDPVGSARRIANESASVVLAEQRKTQASTAFEKVLGNKYMAIPAIKEEFETEWKKYPPHAIATPDILAQNIYNIVVGRHIEEIKQDTDRKEGKYNLVATGGNGRSALDSINTTEKPEELLTDEEKRQAKMFGLTDAEYAASKGGLKYV